MAADYDAPRRTSDDDEPADESLAALRAVGSAHNPTIVEDEANLGEDLELPGADLSGEELVVRILPQQRDEFTCRRCFLVHDASRRARGMDNVCRDCA
jgi:hypothetical protein